MRRFAWQTWLSTALRDGRPFDARRRSRSPESPPSDGPPAPPRKREPGDVATPTTAGGRYDSMERLLPRSRRRTPPDCKGRASGIHCRSMSTTVCRSTMYQLARDREPVTVRFVCSSLLAASTGFTSRSLIWKFDTYLARWSQVVGRGPAGLALKTQAACASEDTALNRTKRCSRRGYQSDRSQCLSRAITG